jgi:hypothetical protein
MRAYERSLVNYIVKRQYDIAQKFLITYNERININSTIKLKKRIPVSPIFYLLRRDNDDITELLKLFLKYSLDLEITDIDGNTPLMLACIKNNINLVNFFLKNKSDVNTSANNKTPLIVAIDNNNKDMIKLLLEHKANINQHNLLPKFVDKLKYESNLHNYSVIKLLLNANADPTVIKGDQFPALVCSLGCYSTIEKIINNENINKMYFYNKKYIRPINKVNNVLLGMSYHPDSYCNQFNLLQICFYNILNLSLLNGENKKRFKDYIKIAKFLVRNNISIKKTRFNCGYMLTNRTFLTRSNPKGFGTTYNGEKNKYIEEILEYKNKYPKEMYKRIYNFLMFPEVLCKLIHSYI